MPASAIVYRRRRLLDQWLKLVHDRELHTGVYVLATGTYTLKVPRIVNPDGGFAIDSVASTLVPTGTVLGQITATSKLIPCVSGATDGSQTPIGILYYDTETATGDSDVLVVEGFARVVAQELVWDTSFDTAPKKAAALAILAGKWVKVADAI